jgi:hypothetical protein
MMPIADVPGPDPESAVEIVVKIIIISETPYI